MGRISRFGWTVLPGAATAATSLGDDRPAPWASEFSGTSRTEHPLRVDVRLALDVFHQHQLFEPPKQQPSSHPTWRQQTQTEEEHARGGLVVLLSGHRAHESLKPQSPSAQFARQLEAFTSTS